ncbi:MAG TPA: transposase [Candidatus Nitrosotalea sp.]|nr:transposase [Candidatus Nitrosotalea sp.]
MKQQAIQYLFLDVHQASVVASVRDAKGSVVMRATVPTEARAILQLVRSAGARLHVGFEEGTQAQWLHDLIAPHVERVLVCNLRGESHSGNKNDRLDADAGSERLRNGSLKPVFHAMPQLITLKELVRNYNNLVEDTTRVMLRIKAIFRARAIATKGAGVYRLSLRKEFLAKIEGGARVRAGSLLTQLDTLLELRPKAKAAMLAEARRQPGWKILRSIPFLGPIRVAEILAIVGTPFRFRTKRNLWPYVGLAVVTRSSADEEFVDGQRRKSRKPPTTRGLNRNHNPILKNVFKAAATSALAKPGPLRDYYLASRKRGVRDELARLTLTRKIVAITLRLWKKGELWNPDKLTMQAT